MDAHEAIVHEMDRDRMRVVLGFPAKPASSRAAGCYTQTDLLPIVRTERPSAATAGQSHDGDVGQRHRRVDRRALVSDFSENGFMRLWRAGRDRSETQDIENREAVCIEAIHMNINPLGSTDPTILTSVTAATILSSNYPLRSTAGPQPLTYRSGYPELLHRTYSA